MAQASPPGYETVSDEAEKVSVLQTPNAGYRTTYYGQASPPGYETVSDEAEKVSVLQTPNAGYRTTFYMGKGSKMVNLNQADPPAQEPVVPAGPEKVSVLETPIASTHTTFYNQLKADPKKKKVDPISPENYDPWVYKFSKENMGNFPNTHGVDTTTSSFMGVSHNATKITPEVLATPEYYF